MADAANKKAPCSPQNRTGQESGDEMIVRKNAAKGNASRRRRIEEAILQSPDRSDRAIAKQLRMSNRTVSICRLRLEKDGKILPRVKSTQSFLACPNAV